MKRHPSLRELSVDHHHGLVQARRLLKVGTGEARDLEGVSPEEVARGFLSFFADHANRHFREEEEVLFPAYARFGDPGAADIVRVLVEHVRIRRLVDDLACQVAGAGPDIETLRAAGELLQAHIRHEENVVFPLIEQALSEEALAHLAVRLRAGASPTSAPDEGVPAD